MIKKIKTFAFYLSVVLLCILPVSVFLWMFMTGLKTQADNLSIPPKIFFSPTLNNFKDVFKSFAAVMGAIDSSRQGKKVYIPDYWKGMDI